MRILNVAEKNDAAKSIAAILSRGQLNRREGFSKFNKIYEFPFTMSGVHCNMIMTSVSGHLMNYEFPPSVKSWQSCDPLVLFDAPVSKGVIKDGEPIKRTLLREIRGCQQLIIWTDCDREGENIGVEVINTCREVNPGITIKRAKFSEITSSAIHYAINQLTQPDYRVSDAVDARQELDLRIGAAFTRFQTLRLQRVFPCSLSNQLVSYGSCQFPTLGFVVGRFREVDRFISEPFWRIQVTVEKDDKAVDFQWKRGRLSDEDCCQAYYDHLLDNRFGQIIEVANRPKSKWRPVALDTVELEKLATRKLRIGAKAAMGIAERLYTRGFISYPRTETNIFPKNIDLSDLVRVQSEDSRWSAFANRVLEAGTNPRNGKSTDKAHPPIHPLKTGVGLQGDEARLFELIVRHFLACVSADAQGAETTIQLCLGKSSHPTSTRQLMTEQDGELFEAKGLVILQSNYLDVYPYDRWSERDIPNFQLGEIISPTNIEMLTGRTSPPPLLTEADLISLMDRHGIGTDATHAEHIETVKQRLYVGLEQAKFLIPGQLGMGLVEGYDAMGFDMSKPHLRAELEADLKLICDGRKTKDDVLQYHLTKYRQLFERAVANAHHLDQAIGHRLEAEPESAASALPSSGASDGPQYIALCPWCSRPLSLRPRRTNQRPLGDTLQNNIPAPGEGAEQHPQWFVTCTGYPICRFAIWMPDSVVSARVAVDQRDGTPQICYQCGSTQNLPERSNESIGHTYKVALRFRVNQRLPNGYYQDDSMKEYVTCLLCDTDLQNALDIRIPSSNPTRVVNGIASNPSRTTQSIQPIRGLHSSVPMQIEEPHISCIVDPFLVNQPSPTPTRVQSFPRPADFQPSVSFSPEQDDAVVCNCGNQAILLTVKKSGPNQGRLFYRCGGGNAGAPNVCDFFLWKTSAMSFNGPMASSTQRNIADDPMNRNSSNFNPYLTPPASTSSRASDSGIVLCRCGESAKLLKVTRPTPNQGREFYACPNSRPSGDSGQQSGCNFFQWADSSDNQTSSFVGSGSFRQQSNYTNRQRSFDANSGDSGITVGHVPMWPPPASSGLRSGSTTGSRRQRTRSRPNQNMRKCGLCGEPGHTRNRCPRVT